MSYIDENGHTIMSFKEDPNGLRTFEGLMTIKWYKNDSGDVRGITIDTKNRKTLNIELKEIRRRFMEVPETDNEVIERYGRDPDELAYSVKFEMNERK